MGKEKTNAWARQKENEIVQGRLALEIGSPLPSPRQTTFPAQPKGCASRARGWGPVFCSPWRWPGDVSRCSGPLAPVFPMFPWLFFCIPFTSQISTASRFRIPGSRSDPSDRDIIASPCVHINYTNYILKRIALWIPNPNFCP
jgi:hypothetical protein